MYFWSPGTQLPSCRCSGRRKRWDIRLQECKDLRVYRGCKRFGKQRPKKEAPATTLRCKPEGKGDQRRERDAGRNHSREDAEGVQKRNSEERRQESAPSTQERRMKAENISVTVRRILPEDRRRAIDCGGSLVTLGGYTLEDPRSLRRNAGLHAREEGG